MTARRGYIDADVDVAFLGNARGGKYATILFTEASCKGNLSIAACNIEKARAYRPHQ